MGNYLRIYLSRRFLERKKLNLSNNIKTVVLCGSAKYKELFDLIDYIMSLNNLIVLKPPNIVNKSLSSYQQMKLQLLHKEKIKRSDAVMILNYNNYIDSITRNEIQYSNTLNKLIIFIYKNKTFNIRLFI